MQRYNLFRCSGDQMGVETSRERKKNSIKTFVGGWERFLDLRVSEIGK